MIFGIEKLFRQRRAHQPRELKRVPWSEADAMLNNGWKLAPEEDTNRNYGFVYLQRPVKGYGNEN